MTQTFTQDVVIDGTTDTTQLTVQGHSTQTGPLQSWQASGSTQLVNVTGDGRLQVGSFANGQMATDDSLIEAHRAETDTSKPKRGLHTLGILTGTLNTIVSWVVQELTLRGTSGIQALHSAVRVRLRNENTGANNASAQLRGLDVEVSNAGATAGSPINEITGMRVGVRTETTGHTQTAYGIKVEMDNSNTHTSYAFYANTGQMRPGDLLETKNIIAGRNIVSFGFQTTFMEELIVIGSGELTIEGSVYVLF